VPHARPAEPRPLRVIAYDVSNTKRRNRVARALTDVGERVQWSVFEAHLDEAALTAVLRQLEGLVDPATDGVRVYTLCAGCAPMLATIGQAVTSEPSTTTTV